MITDNDIMIINIAGSRYFPLMLPIIGSTTKNMLSIPRIKPYRKLAN